MFTQTPHHYGIWGYLAPIRQFAPLLPLRKEYIAYSIFKESGDFLSNTSKFTRKFSNCQFSNVSTLLCHCVTPTYRCIRSAHNFLAFPNILKRNKSKQFRKLEFIIADDKIMNLRSFCRRNDHINDYPTSSVFLVQSSRWTLSPVFPYPSIDRSVVKMVARDLREIFFISFRFIISKIFSALFCNYFSWSTVLINP